MTNEFTAGALKVNGWLDQAQALIDRLGLLSSSMLVLLSCLVLGYLLKTVKRFPNDGIPLAVVMWGILFSFCTAPSKPENIANLAWRMRNVMLGLIIGYASWVLHYYLLSRLEDKIPWLKQFFAERKGLPPCDDTNKVGSTETKV